MDKLSSDQSEPDSPASKLVSICREQKGQTVDYKSEAARFLMAIRKQGEIVEIRCLPSGKGAIYAGLFGDMSLAAAKAVALNGKFKGTYFTLNPASGLATDKISASADTIRDSQILHRSWLLIDIEGDRENAKACNASDPELDRALILAEKVRSEIEESYGCKPLVLCSGNGAHLLYQIDLPNSPEATELVRGGLKGLAAKLSTFEGATLDTTVSNASRISKLPGTLTRKGTHTDDRPQRIARVLDWSVSGQLPKEALDEWSAAAPKPTASAPAPKPGAAGERETSAEPKERARKWLEKRGPAIEGKNGDEFTLKTAAAMVRDFALGDDDALELLLNWNQGNSPPWTEAELREKIAHARKYGKGAYGSALAVKPAGKQSGRRKANPDEEKSSGVWVCKSAVIDPKTISNAKVDSDKSTLLDVDAPPGTLLRSTLEAVNAMTEIPLLVSGRAGTSAVVLSTRRVIPVTNPRALAARLQEPIAFLKLTVNRESGNTKWSTGASTEGIVRDYS